MNQGPKFETRGWGGQEPRQVLSGTAKEMLSELSLLREDTVCVWHTAYLNLYCRHDWGAVATTRPRVHGRRAFSDHQIVPFELDNFFPRGWRSRVKQKANRLQVLKINAVHLIKKAK